MFPLSALHSMGGGGREGGRGMGGGLEGGDERKRHGKREEARGGE